MGSNVCEDRVRIDVGSADGFISGRIEIMEFTLLLIRLCSDFVL